MPGEDFTSSHGAVIEQMPPGNLMGLSGPGATGTIFGDWVIAAHLVTGPALCAHPGPFPSLPCPAVPSGPPLSGHSSPLCATPSSDLYTCLPSPSGPSYNLNSWPPGPQLSSPPQPEGVLTTQSWPCPTPAQSPLLSQPPGCPAFSTMLRPCTHPPIHRARRVWDTVLAAPSFPNILSSPSLPGKAPFSLG